MQEESNGGEDTDLGGFGFLRQQRCRLTRGQETGISYGLPEQGEESSPEVEVGLRDLNRVLTSGMCSAGSCRHRPVRRRQPLWAVGGGLNSAPVCILGLTGCLKRRNVTKSGSVLSLVCTRCCPRTQ